MNALDVRIACADKSGYVEVTARELAFDAFMREHINSRSSHPLKREFTGMISTGAQPMIPLTINDIIPALEEGLIISKLGLPLRTGLAGDYCWPTVSAVEAEVAGEAVALTDKKSRSVRLYPILREWVLPSRLQVRQSTRPRGWHTMLLSSRYRWL